MKQKRRSIDFSPVDYSERFVREYWSGPHNVFIRYFTYLRSGFGLFNEARNYILIILGTWWTLRTGDVFGINPNWVFVVAAIGIPMLVWVGRWDLYKANKARQYITTEHGNVVKWQTHNMQVLQTALLCALARRLGVDVEKVEQDLQNTKN